MTDPTPLARPPYPIAFVLYNRFCRRPPSPVSDYRLGRTPPPPPLFDTSAYPPTSYPLHPLPSLRPLVPLSPTPIHLPNPTTPLTPSTPYPNYTAHPLLPLFSPKTPTPAVFHNTYRGCSLSSNNIFQHYLSNYFYTHMLRFVILLFLSFYFILYFYESHLKSIRAN